MKVFVRFALLTLVAATIGCTDSIMEDVGGGDSADGEDSAGSGGSASGNAQYTRLQLDEDDTTGLLIINDDAAERMFADMSNATVDPEVEDMKERTPAEVSLNDCEGRIGRHVICRKVPRFINDGEALEFDKQGNLLYSHTCFVNLKDFTRGEALDNDAPAGAQ